MKKKPFLSLCIPTNGIIEWVIPVLESIYSQNCNNDEFEVIVTDNGVNSEFYCRMLEYQGKHDNFIYRKTEAVMFLNQIEAFKLAKGELIKFVNHRMTLLPGTLEYLILFAKDNCESKPVTYFLNGTLHLDSPSVICHCFDEYVKTLGNYSSWSAGTAIWKSDFDKIDLKKDFDSLFPHTDIIFSKKIADKYIVDNTPLMRSVLCDEAKKGKYDLFYAFAIQYMDIIRELFDEGHISFDTYEYVRKKNGYAISGWYFEYVIRKQPCSYDLTGYKTSIGKYYKNIEIKVKIVEIVLKRICGKLKHVYKDRSYEKNKE